MLESSAFLFLLLLRSHFGPPHPVKSVFSLSLRAGGHYFHWPAIVVSGRLAVAVAAAAFKPLKLN